MALVDRRWSEEEGCRGALALARELALPLVVVAIDSGEATDGGAPVVDRRDFEAIRAAVAAAINLAPRPPRPVARRLRTRPAGRLQARRQPGQVPEPGSRIRSPSTSAG